MATRHRVAYFAMLALALAALAGYVATVVMVVLELAYPALGATSGLCYICMSPWVQAEYLVGAIVVVLDYIVGLTCASIGFARRDYAWPLAFLALLALVIGLTVLAGSGFSDAMLAKFGVNPRNALLLGAAACALLTPLLALRYSHHLRRAWTPKQAAPAPSRPTLPQPPGP